MRSTTHEHLRRGKVCLDDGPDYPAWISIYVWNGWKCPYLAEPEVRKLKAWFDERKAYWEAQGICENVVLEYDEPTRAWIESYPGDESREPTVYTPTEIDGVTHWPIGSHKWCWWEADEE